MTDFAHFININASAHINVKTAETIENPTVSAVFLLVGMTGFEPAALWSQTRCATKLRYIPTYVLCRFALVKRLVYNSKDIWFCKPRL